MTLNEAELFKAAARIRHANSILLVSHIRPDGDAIGSLVGLGLAFEESGRQVQMVNEDGVPPSLRHLEGSQRVRRCPEGEFDLTVVLDCSDLERTGTALKDRSIPDINIDHHVTNLNFAEINLVDYEAAATSEVIAELFPILGLRFSRPTAAALMTGIITDTLGFRTPNVRPKTFELAGRLMKLGLDTADLYQRALINHPYEAIKFWGSGLKKMERDDRLVWTSLTMEDRKEANYPGRDDADLINILSSIENVDISIIFVEQPNGNIKVSWRAKPGFDVSKVAMEFGGGGHSAASGAEVPGSLFEIKKSVLERTRLIINGGHHV